MLMGFNHPFKINERVSDRLFALIAFCSLTATVAL